MLSHLQLRDFVLVDHAELEFAAGLTALTGETGAGKSIVVDALALIAGGRAAADIVRQGAERAEVAASFAAIPPAAAAWLEAQAIEHHGEILVRRVIGGDGRSRAYLNGQMVPLQSLREFADFVIEIHGQQEFQHLVKRSAQRELLDENLDDAALTRAVADVHERYRSCRREFEALKSAAENRGARLDLLRYQVAELAAEVTTVPAIEALFIERQRVANRGRLAEAARTALNAVYESDGDDAHGLLARAQASLRNAGDADPTLAQAGQFLADAAVQVREAADTLRRYLEALDVDPARQEDLERRAAALETLARKHRLGALELPAQRARLEAELQVLENTGQNLADLQARLDALAREYRAAAARLGKARRAAASELGRQITALMQTLGMSGGRFEVAVTAGEEEFSAHGADDVEFLVSANPGQPPKSLAKVASGGELSRISLAVQVAAASRASPVCMVFDEVDSGIGGAIAEIVGRQLRALGGHAQVLCVTHLPQVASQAHAQFRVTKLSDGKITRTAVKRLTAAERVDEIARMSGGIDITEQARAHAREMLARAESPAGGKKRSTRGAHP
ncbi:MAG: DNA repair protein RecN [Steroidobacteraceae bacterium]|jgi:DNA repair protein RecN (Recombination protein N)